MVNTAAGGVAIVAVEDRGSGIKPEDRGRLFQPFFSTKPEGTGLGLLSSRRLLGELGGRINLYPRHGGGARAVVALPGVVEAVTV